MSKQIPRKTFELAPILDSANFFLKVAEDSADRRQGHIDVIVEILTYAGNYGGFRYLGVDEVPAGQLPGIRGEPPREHDRNAECYRNTDCTRVEYFLRGEKPEPDEPGE